MSKIQSVATVSGWKNADKNCRSALRNSVRRLGEPTTTDPKCGPIFEVELAEIPQATAEASVRICREGLILRIGAPKILISANGV